MRKISIIIATLTLITINAQAQDSEATSASEPTSYIAARAAAEIDWKIISGLHLTATEQLRIYAEESQMNKSYSSLEMSYKILPWLKASAGYTFIYGKEKITEDEKMRHRGFATLTGRYSYGPWKFSLKERIQISHKSYEFNTFQQPENLWQNRAQLKVDYEFPDKPWAPYAAVEVRHTLNGVDPASLATSKTSAGTVDYSEVYIDRWKFSLGTELLINEHNTLDFFLMYERKSDHDIDASKVGVYKSDQWLKSNVATIGLLYSFSIK